jgi:hypothetical protein
MVVNEGVGMRRGKIIDRGLKADYNFLGLERL